MLVPPIFRRITGGGLDNLRSRNLLRSIITGVSGKGVSVVLQLIAIPIAIKSLGLLTFGVYAMLTSAVSWANAASIAITPGLTMQIISSNAESDKNRERKVFVTSLIFGAAISLILIFLMIGSYQLFGPRLFFGTKVLSASIGIKIAFFLAVIFVALGILCSVFEATQAGYQQQYINNSFLILGNCFVVLAIFTLVRNWPSLPSMVFAVVGTPILARAMNALYLVVKHPHLLPLRGAFDLEVLKPLLRQSTPFIGTQLGAIIYQSFTIYWAGRTLGPESAGVISILLLLLSMSGSLLTLITQPLWPALQDARQRNDIYWLNRILKIFYRTTIPYIIFVFLLLLIGARTFVGHFSQKLFYIEFSTVILFSSYSLLSAWEHINYSLLVGFSRFTIASAIYLIGAAITLCAVLYFTKIWGINGILFGICLGPLLTSIVPYPLLIKYELKALNRG